MVKVATVKGAGERDGRAISLRPVRHGASIFACDIQPQTLAKLESDRGRIGVEPATATCDAPSVTDAAPLIEDVVGDVPSDRPCGQTMPARSMLSRSRT